MLFTGCSTQTTVTESETAEKISLVEYTYREKPNRDGFDFYLASLHELTSEGSLKVVTRDSFNAPLHTYTTTAKNLTEDYFKLSTSYPSDTSLINRDTEDVRFSNSFGYMLLLSRKDGGVTVVDFSPKKAVGALKIVADSLLQYKAAEEMRAMGRDTVSLIANFDSLARKHVLPLHPLPPNSLPVKVYKSQE